MNKKEKKAYDFAKNAHKGVKRKGSNLPYVTHPKAVYDILKRLTKDENILCAALLHDVIEDTNCKYKAVKKEFGIKIADIVQEVTKDKNKNFNIRSKSGLMVKLADVLHNISDSKDGKYINKKIKFLLEWVNCPKKEVCYVCKMRKPNYIEG